MKTLITKDSKGKIRVVEIDCCWNDDSAGFIISRTTYQYGGKHTIQPNIIITEGKAKRTVTEQAKLEFNSHLKKYTDKGYKEIPQAIDKYTKEELEEFLPEFSTDGNGCKKHMLAKQADKVANSTFDKLDYWYASRKIDGVRCSFYWKDGEVLSYARGGSDYNPATKPLRTNPTIIKMFKENPWLVLDGELYKHGKSLQQISGAARTEKNTDGIEWLEYYIYDVMEAETPFIDRLRILEGLADEYNIGFAPEREWNVDEAKLQMVPHVTVKGWQNIMKLHNRWVAEGWEGVVIRDPEKNYKFGGRGSEMIKIKEYQDAEFKITGLSEGLRGEDMCFTLVTDRGREFKAKPMGSRELKEQYRNDLPALIGKMATVKFFYLSDDGTPLQPVLKAIRDYE